MLDNWEEFTVLSRWQLMFRLSQKTQEELERLMEPAMPYKRMFHSSITKVMQSNGNKKEFKNNVWL